MNWDQDPGVVPAAPTLNDPFINKFLEKQWAAYQAAKASGNWPNASEYGYVPIGKAPIHASSAEALAKLMADDIQLPWDEQAPGKAMIVTDYGYDHAKTTYSFTVSPTAKSGDIIEFGKFRVQLK